MLSEKALLNKKEYNKKYMEAYYQKNKKKFQENFKKSYEKNKNKIRLKQSDYYFRVLKPKRQEKRIKSNE